MYIVFQRSKAKWDIDDMGGGEGVGESKAIIFFFLIICYENCYQ